MSDIEPLFSTDEVKFKSGCLKCRLEPGVWETCEASKDKAVMSRRAGSISKDGFTTKGHFVKEHDRFLREDDLEMFFIDGRGRKTIIGSLDFGLGPKVGKMFSRLGDAAWTLVELAFCRLLPVMLIAVIVAAVVCAIYEQGKEKDEMRGQGWTEIDVPNDRRVEAETLARERARNEFGDAEGKYAFHCRVAGGSFWYKAHSVTNACGECGK